MNYGVISFVDLGTFIPNCDLATFSIKLNAKCKATLLRITFMMETLLTFYSFYNILTTKQMK